MYKQLWSIESNGDERKVTYLSTLRKHTQAVNVVRWCPRGVYNPQSLLSRYSLADADTGELLASAGDDGNVLLWTPADNPAYASNFGDDGQEDVEHWRVKTMCRSSSGSEIYDLAWSPDGMFFMTGSMDNVARIYNATTGEWTSFTFALHCEILIFCRPNCSPNCRAQPLRAGRGMGSSERICCNAIFRSLCAHLHTQNQGRPIYAKPTQQSHQNGFAGTTDIIE